MPNILGLMSEAVGQPQRQVVYGQVSTRKPAPTSFGDLLHLTIPDWSADQDLTVANWPACHGTTLPAQGADCLLVYDHQRNLRCAWWSGPTVFSPAAMGIRLPAAGTATLSWSASTNSATTTVAHGLVAANGSALTPTAVVATSVSAGAFAAIPNCNTTNFTPTTFQLNAVTASAVTGTGTVTWLAY